MKKNNLLFVWFDPTSLKLRRAGGRLLLSLPKDTTNGKNKHLVPFVLSLSKYTNILLFLFCYLTNATPSLETGMEYQKNEQFTQAITCYEEIIQSNPYNIQAMFNLGCCYLAIGQGEKAIAAFSYVTDLSPDALPAHYNKAFAHKTCGSVDAAIEGYKNIIAAHPDYEPAQLGLGFAYIAKGDFEHGWKQHERYLKQSGKNGDALRSLLRNDTVAYKKILLRPEGDFGDTLLFVRYAERLKKMNADVIVACQPQLIPLLSRCSYIDQLIPCNARTPENNADATLMSLPAIFNDNDETAPNNIPYLFADPALVSYWKTRLAADTNFKVGICWEASVKNDVSRSPIARRGCPLEQFSRLSDIDGVSFYSLQKYDGVEQLTTLSPAFSLHVFDNLDEKSGPFMDTAAIIKNLDLIITVDTSIPHLAGGLGAQVWLLLPYATDWRWLCNRTDSFWYPTMRIFKQQTPLDWNGVMEMVHDALQQLTSKK
ncbi:MAG TPA: tetratricopeptide repeat-containing glycosyltransferase family protein [Candidatus Babeliales bacterium]|jgi:tetratricopeptide (TPR) repeat protein|nr:tetratricopeptide repeat-containing glycosyltransferase family protein [Candidatus Babeliales bacterium]